MKHTSVLVIIPRRWGWMWLPHQKVRDGHHRLRNIHKGFWSHSGWATPDCSSLWLKFKFFDNHVQPFHIEAHPPPLPRPREIVLRVTISTPTSMVTNWFWNALILVRVPDVTEMTSNPQQLQTQLVVEQDAVASWDSLREVSFFLVSMFGQAQSRSIEWFSFECRKTKTKVITLTSQSQRHRQYSEPIKTRSNYM